MAKRPQDSDFDLDPRKPTRPPEPAGELADLLSDEKLNEGRIMSAGVGMKQGEFDAFTKLAARLGEGVTRNALMRLALRSWLQQVREGKVDLSEFVYEPPKPKKKIRIPGEKREEE